MIYLANAFSLNMLNVNEATIEVKKADLNHVKEIVHKNKVESVIGHESTAQILSKMLSADVKTNRIPIKLNKGDIVVVFQLNTRLPEGKVLNESEINEIVSKGQYGFYIVHIR